MTKLSLDPSLYSSANSAVDLRYMEQIAAQDAHPCPTDPSKPRVVLVVGPSPFSMMRGWEFFLTSPYEGISYIATVVHNAGYPVRIVDARYRVDPLHEAFREILDGGCDLVGIATYEDGYPFVEELIALLKDARPDLPVVLGGSLVTSVPHVFMAETRADVSVISEGEVTILELLDAYVDGRWEQRLPEIHGIWYRAADGSVQHTRPRGQADHLDWLPHMDLSLWPQANDPRGLQPQFITSHSRGCKMDCSFCYRTTPQLREKSPAKLRSELARLKERYKAEFLFFTDLTFTSEKKRALEICEVIQDYDVHWTCMTRCADVDPEILRAMRKAGCDIILFGVESLSMDVLKTARKGSSESIAHRAMVASEEAGIRFGTLLILGLPGETPESLEHACRWAEAHQNIVRVKYLSAMPGTTVYHEGLKKGLIRSEVEHLRWLSVEQGLVHDEFLNYNNLPEDVTRRAYERIYACYGKGPVMDFRHFPEHFAYFYPDANKDWRREFSSSSSLRVPGVERFRIPGLTPSERWLAPA